MSRIFYLMRGLDHVGQSRKLLTGGFMTNQHPITPPPEMVQQWISKFYGTHLVPGEAGTDLATRAAQWGADQELEACCEWLDERAVLNGSTALRAARRPKPPSLKEQALLALSHLVKGADESMDTMEAAEYVRRALEQLND
jgi:hypothetical protein